MLPDSRNSPGALLPNHAGRGGLERHPHRVPARIEEFNSIVNHLSALRTEESIDDAAFADLVKYAAALYVEAEITDRVNEVLENSLKQIAF